MLRRLRQPSSEILHVAGWTHFANCARRAVHQLRMHTSNDMHGRQPSFLMVSAKLAGKNTEWMLHTSTDFECQVLHARLRKRFWKASLQQLSKRRRQQHKTAASSTKRCQTRSPKATYPRYESSSIRLSHKFHHPPGLPLQDSWGWRANLRLQERCAKITMIPGTA